MSFQVHDSAIIDENVTIGSGTKIWHFSHVSSGANIGNNCSLGQNVYVDAKVKIGNNVKIQNNVSVYEGVEIEDNVFCGPSMVFTNVYNPRSSINRKNEFRRTLVKNGATIGANATIVCGITIGEHAFIGAGSVIKRNVKPYEIIVGVPGRHIGWMCSCGVRLPFTNEFKVVACNVCGLMFMLEQNECSLVRN